MKTIILNLLTTLLMAQAGSSWAGGVLTGHVQDFVSRQGIVATTVEMRATNQTKIAATITDGNGDFQQSGLPAGEILINYRKVGYSQFPTIRKVQIEEDETSRSDVTLFANNWDNNDYILQCAQRIKNEAAKAGADIGEVYSAQWRMLSESGIKPEVKAKVADELKQLDINSTHVPGIKIYMGLPKEELKATSAALNFSTQDESPALNTTESQIPKEVKVDLVRFHLQNDALTPETRKLYLNSVEQNLGRDIRAEAEHPAQANP